MRSDSVSKMKNEQQWKKREQEHKIEFFCKCEKKFFEGKYDICYAAKCNNWRKM